MFWWGLLVGLVIGCIALDQAFRYTKRLEIHNRKIWADKLEACENELEEIKNELAKEKRRKKK